MLWRKKLSSVGIVAFLFIASLSTVFFQQVTAEEPIDNTSAENTEPFVYWYAPENSFGVQEMKTVNWDYFWNLFKQHSAWQMEGWNPITEEWIDNYQGVNLNEWLDISKIRSDTNDSEKITINFTSPYTTKYRFTFGIDLRVKEYINRTGQYEYTLTYPANTIENYTVSFNWSDVMPMVENGTISLKHGIKNINGKDIFWFHIIANQNLPVGKSFEIDPYFGYAGVDGGWEQIIGAITKDDYQMGDNHGEADNISVFVYIAVVEDSYVKVRGIIQDIEGNLIDEGNSDEINLTESTGLGVWITFNFTEKKPFLESNTWYYLGIEFTDITGWSIAYYMYNDISENMSIYCNYSKVYPIDISKTSESTAYNNGRKLVRTSDSNLHCVYMNFNENLRSVVYGKSTDNGTTWENTHLTPEYNYLYPSIAVDSKDNLHVLYSNGTMIIEYIKYDGLSWSTPINLTFNPNYSYGFPSIAVDSNDNIHVVWDTEIIGVGQIQYSNYDGSWSTPINLTSEPEPRSQASPSIAIDNNDVIHIVWWGTHIGSTEYFQIRYCNCINGNWGNIINITSSIIYHQEFPCIAIDSINNIHISFSGIISELPSYPQTRYCKYDGLSWSTPINLTSDPEYYQEFSSIAVDINDNIHVVWYGYHVDSPDIFQIRYCNYTESWSNPINLTSSFGDQQHPNLIFATYPIVDTVKTNIPETGYAFIWTNNDNPYYYDSTDLSWQEALYPTVVTNDTTNIEETSAMPNGFLADDAGYVCRYRFEYDTDTGVPYVFSTPWTGAINTGQEFSYGISSLAKGELYFIRAQCNTSTGNISSGGEKTFLTKPDGPTDLYPVRNGALLQIDLTWDKGEGGYKTHIVRKIGSNPTNYWDGVVVYNGTLDRYEDGAVVTGMHYFYRAWMYCSDGGLWRYSDESDENNIIALAPATFDIRDILIIDDVVPDLEISVVVENRGAILADIPVSWVLTRLDDSTVLDLGADTFAVSPFSSVTYTITPTTNYVGNIVINFTGDGIYTSGLFSTKSPPAPIPVGPSYRPALPPTVPPPVPPPVAVPSLPYWFPLIFVVSACLLVFLLFLLKKEEEVLTYNRRGSYLARN